MRACSLSSCRKQKVHSTCSMTTRFIIPRSLRTWTNQRITNPFFHPLVHFLNEGLFIFCHYLFAYWFAMILYDFFTSSNKVIKEIVVNDEKKNYGNIIWSNSIACASNGDIFMVDRFEHRSKLIKLIHIH